jgi:hypothetical protein
LDAAELARERQAVQLEGRISREDRVELARRLHGLAVLQR